MLGQTSTGDAGFANRAHDASAVKLVNAKNTLPDAGLKLLRGIMAQPRISVKQYQLAGRQGDEGSSREALPTLGIRAVAAPRSEDVAEMRSRMGQRRNTQSRLPRFQIGAGHVRVRLGSSVCRGTDRQCRSPTTRILWEVWQNWRLPDRACGLCCRNTGTRCKQTGPLSDFAAM